MNLNFCVEELNISGRNLKAIYYGEVFFKEKWQEFLANYPRYSFRYNIETLEYYSAFLNKNSYTKSVVIINSENVPLAICPLLIIDFDGNNYASINDKLPLPAPLFNLALSEKQKRRVFDFLNIQLLSIFKDHNVKRWYSKAEAITFGVEALEEAFPAIIGGIDASVHHHIIDLNVSEEELRLQLREKARQEINNGLKYYQFKSYDQNNFEHETIGERYRQLHFKAAGKVTRSRETFTQMNDWILNGNAIMYEQLFNGDTVNMTIMAIGKKAAYGASTANDRDFTAPAPMMQSMMWYIFRDLKERGIDFYDVGRTPIRDHLHYFITEKQKKISYFKKGFGKYHFPLKIWIWFQSHQEELKYLEEQLNNYKSHLNGEYNSYHA